MRAKGGLGSPELEQLVAATGLSGLESTASAGEILATVRHLGELRRKGLAPELEVLLRAEALRNWKEAGREDCKDLWAATDPRRGSGRAGPVQGAALEIRDPELWPEPVDTARLLDELVEIFRRHLILPAAGAETLALWTLHTWTLDVAEASPVLVCTSPEKRCGKTTTLRLLGVLAHRPLSSASITAPALFRTVAQVRPTLLVDEADTLSQSDDLRAVLNAGHSHDTAWVIRTVGDDHEPRRFSTWCAKALALIGKLWPALEDRSIVLRFRRRARDEQVARVTKRVLAGHGDVARRCASWARDHVERLRDADPAVPEALHDRAADNWRPLLAIADVAGSGWGLRAREVAETLTGAALESESSARILILSDLRELFAERSTNRLKSAEIVETLGRRGERPWSEWRRGRPLTERQLAELLKPFGITPGSIRLADGATAKGYRVEQFSDTWARFLPSDPSHRHNAVAAGLFADPESVTPSACDGSPLAREPVPRLDCAGVTDRGGTRGMAAPSAPLVRVRACGHAEPLEPWTDTGGVIVCGICHPNPGLSKAVQT